MLQHSRQTGLLVDRILTFFSRVRAPQTSDAVAAWTVEAEVRFRVSTNLGRCFGCTGMGGDLSPD